MLVQSGEKVHVIIRRRFETDLRRHLVGEIQEVYATSARITGYDFFLDTTKNQFIKKTVIRTTIIDLAESGYVVNILPDEVELDNLKYVINEQKRLVMTDNAGFVLDINEFGFNR